MEGTSDLLVLNARTGNVLGRRPLKEDAKAKKGTVK